MMFWMVLFWAVVIGGTAWLIVSLSRHRQQSDAADVLRARLASGEIEVEEYNRRNAALNADTSGGRAAPWLIAGGLLALVLFIVIPAVVMATNVDTWDMDMWDMHGGGRNTTGDPLVRGGIEENVRIEGFAFWPGNLEVPVGASVTWRNEDSALHDATARNGDWQTLRLSGGESDTLTFDTAGAYDYYCSIHPSMQARLVVR
jgi:plastocyanin